MLEMDVPIKVVASVADLETVEAEEIFALGVDVVEATIAPLTLEVALELVWTGEDQVATIALDWLDNLIRRVLTGSDRCDVASFTV